MSALLAERRSIAFMLHDDRPPGVETPGGRQVVGMEGASRCRCARGVQAQATLPSAATPGSVLPSSSSSEAPPPVEM